MAASTGASQRLSPDDSLSLIVAGLVIDFVSILLVLAPFVDEVDFAGFIVSYRFVVTPGLFRWWCRHNCRIRGAIDRTVQRAPSIDGRAG